MTEVATVVLNRCITDNKSKEISENDEDYCITYNYEYLEDYIEKMDAENDGDGPGSGEHDANQG